MLFNAIWPLFLEMAGSPIRILRTEVQVVIRIGLSQQRGRKLIACTALTTYELAFLTRVEYISLDYRTG